MAMTSVIIVFILTLIISFSASLQASPVSVGVVRAASQGRWSASWAKTFGGVLAESIHAGLAILFAELIYISFGEWKPMDIIGPMVLTGFGIYLILGANRKFIRGRTLIPNTGNPFLVGFKLGLYNFQVFMFYAGLLLAFYQFGMKPDLMIPRIIAFIGGATLGLFLLLYLFIYLVKRRGGISRHFTGARIMLTCGSILVIVGIYQLINALKSL